MSRPPVTIPAEEYDRLRAEAIGGKRLAAMLLDGAHISENAPPRVFAAVRRMLEPVANPEEDPHA